VIFSIKEWNDPVLREIAKPVENINTRIQELVYSMMETMYHIGAAGLAANQIGVPLRMFIVDRSAINESTLIAINPEIITRSDKMHTNGEGCFSLPGVYGLVTRPHTIELAAQDMKGTQYTMQLNPNAWMSVVAQHELDHLDGVFFVDYAQELWEDENGVTATYKAKR
jgi:peptide deformylase